MSVGIPFSGPENISWHRPSGRCSHRAEARCHEHGL